MRSEAPEVWAHPKGACLMGKGRQFARCGSIFAIRVGWTQCPMLVAKSCGRS